jgi:hypothetical protein
VARWQYGSQICFATFKSGKITKLLITQQGMKPEKISTDFGILRILEI